MAIDDEGADDNNQIGSAVQQKPPAGGLLQDPRVRNALFSFAAQMLQPSWSPMGNLGMAIGHAGEAAGSTEEFQQRHELEQQKLEQAKDLAKLHADTTLKAAQIHADTLKSITQQRLQSKGLQDSPIWKSTYLAHYNDLLANPGMDEPTRHAIAMQRANEAAEAYAKIHGANASGMSETRTGAGAAPAGAAALNPAATKGRAPWEGFGGVASKIDQEKFANDPAYRQQLKDLGYKSEVEDLEKKMKVTAGGKPGTVGELSAQPLGKNLQDLFELLRPKGAAAPVPAAPGGGFTPGL